MYIQPCLKQNWYIENKLFNDADVIFLIGNNVPVSLDLDGEQTNFGVNCINEVRNGIALSEDFVRLLYQSCIGELIKSYISNDSGTCIFYIKL